MRQVFAWVIGFFLCSGVSNAGRPAAGAAALEPVPADTVERIKAALPETASAKPARPHKVLVFTLTRGFRHSSIAAGAKAFELLGEKTKAFRVTVTDDIGVFEPAKLRAFDACVLMNNTGELFLPADFGKLAPADAEKAKKRDEALKASLLAFVRRGNGLVGIHAATDCWYEWPEFGPLIGGWFNGHPWNEKVGVKIEDPANPLVAAFGGKDFEVKDEIYTFRNPWSRRHLRVLLTLDRAKTPQKGNRTDNDYALAWVRAEGKGNVFYCGFGHDDEIFWNPAMLRFMLDGTQFALGDLAADASPSSAAIDDPVDPFIGEYSGTFTRTVGGAVKAEARVFPISETRFRATLESGDLKVEAAGEFDGRQVPLAKASFDDYVIAWEVAGPFTAEGKKGEDLVDAPFPPEEPNVAGVAWKPVKAESGPAGPVPIVDLMKAVGGNDRVAYMRAKLVSPVDQDASLEIGSDDGVKAWLNGKLVHANGAMRGLEPGQDVVAVRLVKGENTLLLKIIQGAGDWAGCAAVVPRGGGALQGVRGPATGEIRWTGRIADGRLGLAGTPGTWVLRKTARKSPAEGAAPPPGAIVLLASGAPTMTEWDNQNWKVIPDGSVQVNDGDARTKRQFGDLTLHVEFRVPYLPGAAGQDRGNSGVYLDDRYEIQVLDSFGVEPESHQCGGIYNTAAPKVNAALPPGVWQTYDIVFRGPRLNPDGSLKEPAVFVKVEWNGVLVHENVEVRAQTGGAPETNAEKGPIRLQDHGHPVRYRNVWIVEGAGGK